MAANYRAVTQGGWTVGEACTISPADPPETTLPYTGSDPFFKIAPADSAAYAAKEGVLCNDIFAAS